MFLFLLKARHSNMKNISKFSNTEDLIIHILSTSFVLSKTNFCRRGKLTGIVLQNTSL